MTNFASSCETTASEACMCPLVKEKLRRRRSMLLDKLARMNDTLRKAKNGEKGTILLPRKLPFSTSSEASDSPLAGISVLPGEEAAEDMEESDCSPFPCGQKIQEVAELPCSSETVGDSPTSQAVSVCGEEFGELGGPVLRDSPAFTLPIRPEVRPKAKQRCKCFPCDMERKKWEDLEDSKYPLFEIVKDLQEKLNDVRDLLVLTEDTGSLSSTSTTLSSLQAELCLLCADLGGNL